MSIYQVNKLVYDMKRDDSLADIFMADRRALLARYDLSQEEARALLELDLGWLYRAGVIPNLLFRLGLVANLSEAEYARAMSAARG